MRAEQLAVGLGYRHRRRVTVPVMQRTIVSLISDISGAEAQQTILYSVGGKAYEIDLTDKEAVDFRATLEPFVKVSRTKGQAAASGTGNKPKKTSKSASKQERETVRAWAREHGHTVGDRGRVPQSVTDAYDAAHS